MKAKDPKAAAERVAEYEAWYEEQVGLGLEDLDAGRVVSDEDVNRYFEQRFKQHAGRQQKQAA
jgi:predicted transcriptional regulator